MISSFQYKYKFSMFTNNGEMTFSKPFVSCGPPISASTVIKNVSIFDELHHTTRQYRESSVASYHYVSTDLVMRVVWHTIAFYRIYFSFFMRLTTHSNPQFGSDTSRALLVATILMRYYCAWCNLRRFVLSYVWLLHHTFQPSCVVV